MARGPRLGRGTIPHFAVVPANGRASAAGVPPPSGFLPGLPSLPDRCCRRINACPHARPAASLHRSLTCPSMPKAPFAPPGHRGPLRSCGAHHSRRDCDCQAPARVLRRYLLDLTRGPPRPHGYRTRRADDSRPPEPSRHPSPESMQSLTGRRTKRGDRGRLGHAAGCRIQRAVEKEIRTRWVLSRCSVRSSREERSCFRFKSSSSKVYWLNR